MGVTKANNGKTWYSIRSSQICPICGHKDGRCSFLADDNTGDVILYKCKHNTSGKPDNRGWYLHFVNDGKEVTNQKTFVPNKIDLSNYKPREFKKEDLILWDKVYRKMKSTLFSLTGSYLYNNHKKNLIDRGFTEKEILDMGFFSVPNNLKINYNGFNCTTRTAIINELKKEFKDEELLRVPGFSIVKNGDKSFITFKNTMYNRETKKFEDLDAYFIPYHNQNGLLVGMQFRLTTAIVNEKGKKMRYLWYSSEEVTCGSPIDYYIPKEIDIDNAILISEGAIKTKFSASKLKIRGLAEAGVGNYQNLIKTLQSIEEKEGKKYNILLALDMDKYTNNDVIAAEIRTVTLLKACGYNVTILEWNVEEGKGLDDKLLATGKKDLRFLSI